MAGFREVKAKVIRCLLKGQVLHEARSSVDVKNQLLTGEVSAEQLAEVIRRARGDAYECRKHHFDSSIDVHILKVSSLGRSWYIKWYFLEPNSVFISVH